MNIEQKIESAYNIVQKIKEVDSKLSYYDSKAQLIANGKSELTLDFLFNDKPEHTNKEDVFNEDGFIRDEFLGSEHEKKNNEDSSSYGFIIPRGVLDDINRGFPTTNNNTSYTLKSGKRETIKDTVSLQLIGILISDLMEERKTLALQLKRYM